VTRLYPGPLRDEPLALELRNTLYAVRGELVDGLEHSDGLAAWLAAIGERLPAAAAGAGSSRHRDFLSLRSAVRDALDAAVAAEEVPADVLNEINAVAARAPASPQAIRDEADHLRGDMRYHATDPTDVALAALAADAIGLLTDPDRHDLRACGAPGCVLMFLRDHPRRTWCSETCGNRARQARHYERVRRARR
jgi:predicted RNA-binding Zn ribbon-like protein